MIFTLVDFVCPATSWHYQPVVITRKHADERASIDDVNVPVSSIRQLTVDVDVPAHTHSHIAAIARAAENLCIVWNVEDLEQLEAMPIVSVDPESGVRICAAEEILPIGSHRGVEAIVGEGSGHWALELIQVPAEAG